MIAKIIIRRSFKEGNTREIVRLLNNLRTKILGQHGYISGETLIQIERPNKLVVISTWDTLKDWENWKESEDRRKIEAKLETFQMRPTEYEELLVGTPLQKKIIFPI